MALEKRRPWLPASAQSFTSSRLTTWKRAHLPALLGGGSFVVQFCWWRWWPSSILVLQKPPENSGEESPSCSQLLSLVGLASPPPHSPQQVCGESAGQCLLMGTVSLLPSSSAKKLMSPTRKKVVFSAANWASSKCRLGSGASFPPARPDALGQAVRAWALGRWRSHALFAGSSPGFPSILSITLGVA